VKRFVRVIVVPRYIASAEDESICYTTQKMKHVYILASRFFLACARAHLRPVPVRRPLGAQWRWSRPRSRILHRVTRVPLRGNRTYERWRGQRKKRVLRCDVSVLPEEFITLWGTS